MGLLRHLLPLPMVPVLLALLVEDQHLVLVLPIRGTDKVVAIRAKAAVTRVRVADIRAKAVVHQEPVAIRATTLDLQVLATRGIIPVQLEQATKVTIPDLPVLATRATTLVLPVLLASSHAQVGTNHVPVVPQVDSDHKAAVLEVVLPSIARVVVVQDQEELLEVGNSN